MTIALEQTNPYVHPLEQNPQPDIQCNAIASMPNLPTLQTSPLPIFADNLYTELRSTQTINDLSDVMDKVLKVFDINDTLRTSDALNDAKAQVEKYFKPYKTALNQVLTPSEEQPKVHFEHPAWSLESIIKWIQAEKPKNPEQMMPIPNGLAYIDTRPSRPSDWNPETNAYNQLPVQQHTEAYPGRVYIAPDPGADPVVNEQLYVPPREAIPYLPARPGYPEIKTGKPILYNGHPQIDKENNCIIHQGPKDIQDNIDIPMTILEFQTFANSVGYGQEHAMHFLERLAKLKWGPNGFDTYKVYTTADEVANAMIQITWRPKQIENIEQTQNFERKPGENIYTTYNRLVQSITLCLSFMPDTKERNEQATKLADKGIINLIHPGLQHRIKAARTLSNYNQQKHIVKWDLRYIEWNEANSPHLRLTVPLKLKSEVQGINVNFHQLQNIDLFQAFPALYAGVKRQRDPEEPLPPSAPLDKKYRPSSTYMPPTQATSNPFNMPAVQKPTQPTQTQIDAPINTHPQTKQQTPPPKRPMTPSQSQTGRTSPTPRPRPWQSPQRRSGPYPYQGQIVYDKQKQKFIRDRSTTPQRPATPQPSQTNQTLTRPSTPQPQPQQQQRGFSPTQQHRSSLPTQQQQHALLPTQQQQRGYSPARQQQNDLTKLQLYPKPKQRPYAYSPSRGLSPGNFYNGNQRQFSPYTNNRDNNYYRRFSRSPSPFRPFNRYSSLDRPGRSSSRSLQRQRTTSPSPRAAFRQTERNMYYILDRKNIDFWRNKDCHICKEYGHSAAVCSQITCKQCHLKGQHLTDYHCLLARRKHNLIMTAANPPRYKNYNQQPYTPYKQPNNTTSQQQPSVNNTTIKEDLIPIFTAALESTLPKYVIPTTKDDTSTSTTQPPSKNTI